MKGGVPNAELAMKKLLKHIKSVYQIPQKIKRLTDHREKSLIGHEQVVMAVLIFLLLQYESFHTIFSAPESMKKRLKHVIKGRIPKADAVREVLKRTDSGEVEKILSSVTARIRRNRVLQQPGTIGRYVVAVRSWLKATGVQMGHASRQNREQQRIWELESEVRSLRKQLGEKEEVIDILKKSVGILSKP